jgi:exodeoxyribonuclease VII small subunit
MAKKELSYKEAINEIEDILSKIENEELDVDDLSAKVERVSMLIKKCKKKLTETEDKVQKILEDIDE